MSISVAAGATPSAGMQSGDVWKWASKPLSVRSTSADALSSLTGVSEDAYSGYEGSAATLSACSSGDDLSAGAAGAAAEAGDGPSANAGPSHAARHSRRTVFRTLSLSDPAGPTAHDESMESAQVHPLM